VDNNNIREVANSDTITLFSQNGSGASGTGAARFKITNNTLPLPTGTNQSIGCGAGVPCMPEGPLFSLADEGNSTCLHISGNSIYDANSLVPGLQDIYLATRTGPPAGAVTMVETGVNGGNSAAALAFLNSNNTLSGSNKSFDESGTVTTTASCGAFPP